MLLAVHAPHLARVDVYPARQGPRLAALRTRGGAGCLLAPGALFGRGSPLGGARGGGGGGGAGAGGCWMLDCASGELWSVDEAVAATLRAAPAGPSQPAAALPAWAGSAGVGAGVPG